MKEPEITIQTIKDESQDDVVKNTTKNSLKQWQKNLVIIASVILLAGLGTVIALELINKNNQSDSSSTPTYSNSTTEVTEKDDDAFSDAAKYTLELKDGENLIEKPGVYTVSGSTESGFIHVNAGDEKVKIILDNVSITNQNGAAIYVESNGNVHIETVGKNTLNANPTEDIDAAIYSKADLILKGDGQLDIISSIDGIHSADDLKIKSGTITVKAEEDGIKGKDSLTIQDGTITVEAGDDGLKASNDEEEDKGVLTISGGTIKVTKSKEAIEAAKVEISGGDIDVTSTDDGINAAADFCAQMAMSPTKNANVTTCSLTISGGTLRVNAGGDGLDANGSIYLSGGTVYVDGPSNAGNGALDYDGVFDITGGTIIATGSSGMALNASSSTQGSALVNMSSSYQSGSKITIGDIEFTPSKSFNSVMVSSPTFKKGESYNLTINGETLQTIEFTDYLVSQGNGGMNGGMGGEMMRGGREQMEGPQRR